MPGRMTRSAPQSPFELPEVKAVRPRHPPVLPERRKSEKIHAGSGFIWRISVKYNSIHDCLSIDRRFPWPTRTII
jgi:hypothetical protein